MRKTKAIVLYSGGLDSLLAAKILIDLGVDVTGFHCVLPFVAPDEDLNTLKPAIHATQIGLNLHFYRCGDDYINMVMNPAHGYGKYMNPCVDCKIFFIKKAAGYMKETGADLIATGEVVGQRPMSQQKNTMNHILNESGLEGRLLRPLSAKLLKPTIPETEGLIDRDKLLDLNGRSRTAQFDLARKFGIKDYASPAGGCLFTDKHIASRVKDLFDHHEGEINQTDMYLLTIGRHRRLSPESKLITGRNHSENILLEKYKSNSDLLLVPDFKGPSAQIKGNPPEEDIAHAASMIRSYGKPEENQNQVSIYKNGVFEGKA